MTLLLVPAWMLPTVSTAVSVAVPRGPHWWPRCRPPAVRELRELVRHRAKLVTVRSGFKAGVHACWPSRACTSRSRTCSARPARVELAAAPLDRAYRARVNAYLRLVDALDVERIVRLAARWIAARLASAGNPTVSECMAWPCRRVPGWSTTRSGGRGKGTVP